MKKIFISALALATSCSSLFAATPMLRAGTSVPVMFVQCYDSYNEEAPVLVVSSDIYDYERNVIIEANTPVMVISNTTQHARGIGRPGVVEFNGFTTKAVNGETIQLVGSFCREGLDKRGKALGLGLGLGLGTGILPLLALMAIKGDEAKVCSGTQIGSIATISNVEIK